MAHLARSGSTVRVATPAELDAWLADLGGRAKADAAFWRGFASRVADPCIEAGVTYGDNNHFELDLSRPGCGATVGAGVPPSLPRMLVAGALVGLGTALGGGCTSGHGVCGMSRLSPRSVLATATFIASGMVAVAVVNLAGGAW